MVVNTYVARLVARKSTIPTHIRLFSEPQRDEEVAHLAGTSQFDVPCNKDVVHEDVQLCAFLLKTTSPRRLYRYKVVVMSALLKGLQNQAAFLRHKRLVRRLGEA